MTRFGIRPVTAVAAVLAAVIFTVFALAPTTSGAPVASAQTPPNYSTYPYGYCCSQITGDPYLFSAYGYGGSYSPYSSYGAYGYGSSYSSYGSYYGSSYSPYSSYYGSSYYPYSSYGAYGYGSVYSPYSSYYGSVYSPYSSYYGSSYYPYSSSYGGVYSPYSSYGYGYGSSTCLSYYACYP